ncbi:MULTISPECIES: hypothetical protein [unclassified Thalassospira]|jgi:hypothetical protein|uniref:hypothetical protein n=1 Tax=unclassified Thalassospira TaxID=2648997 RepID=UPI0007A621F7|nr:MULTISPECIES: hypothetical protein [unclassified Thalassospira]KZC98532.1 hypothetical protein AUQ41_14305 [Thalassospira sp. MCCC 1A02898]ONH86838.1 hypothetical protein TH47_15415 [Thalassospira sp. MCCC 1A02803]
MVRAFFPKKALLIGLGLLIIGSGVGVLGVRSYFVAQAERHAQQIIKSAEIENATEAETLLRISAEVHREFSEVSPRSILLLRLRPYLTHPLLPKFVQFPNGVIETVLQKGLCDNAARNLAFILAELGYQSFQWDMVQTGAAHSALLVNLSDKSTALLDPFYGTASYSIQENKLISPELAQKKLREGGKTVDYFIPFSDTSQLWFYEKFEDSWMAKQGDELMIPVVIPSIGKGRLILGELNGSSDDVVATSIQNEMTPYWGYVGHKYNRSWVRTLRARQDVEVEFNLVQEVENSVVTSDPLPDIDGRRMRWRLKAGEEIQFFDGRARRSFTRMNSYLDVDQIVIRPID